MSAIVYDFKTGRVITSAPVPKPKRSKNAKIKLIEVWDKHGNPDEGSLYTPEAYAELRLQMSTGDFHTHGHREVLVDEVNWDITTDLDMLRFDSEYL